MNIEALKQNQLLYQIQQLQKQIKCREQKKKSGIF
jgi:hypothetical protein